jgi:peptidoglycan hydrolase CwlO-like protein
MPERSLEEELERAVRALDACTNDCASLLEQAAETLEPLVVQRHTLEGEALEAAAHLVDAMRAALRRRRAALEEVARAGTAISRSSRRA